MVIILKHSATLQDFIVTVEKEDGQNILKNGIQSLSAIRVKNPLALVPQQDPQSGGIRMSLVPFSFILKEDAEIVWDASHFLTAFEAHDEMEQLYIRHTSSIEIATTIPKGR